MLRYFVSIIIIIIHSASVYSHTHAVNIYSDEALTSISKANSIKEFIEERSSELDTNILSLDGNYPIGSS